MNNETFWLNNFFILFRKDKIFELWITPNQTFEEKLNAITRLVLFLSVIGFIMTSSMKILITGLVTLFIIVIAYKSQNKKDNKNKKEKIKQMLKEGFTNPEFYNEIKSNFTQPTKENPLMNVMLTDYVDNPQRKMAAPAYNSAVEKEINDSFKENMDKRLFKDLGDEIEFEHSMRNFYTMPSTTIPNDQETFIKFCYGNPASCRDGDYQQCEKHIPRHINP
jgi:hypothetical protein